MRSPFTSTTVGRSDAFLGCGSPTGNTYKFFVVLLPGSSISIGQTSNQFDSTHSVFWSTSTDPSSYSSAPHGDQTRGTVCTDDPDTQTVTRTNSQSAPRKLWFVVNGYNSSEVGAFTLAWTISTGSSGE